MDDPESDDHAAGRIAARPGPPRPDAAPGRCRPACTRSAWATGGTGCCGCRCRRRRPGRCR